MDQRDLAAIESETYRAAVDHGFWDMTVGFTLLVMGVSMAAGMAWFVGLAPAAAARAWASVRANVIEPRVGFVRLRPERTIKMRWAVCAGAATMALAILVPFGIGAWTGVKMGRIPGLPALLTVGVLALPIAVSGYLLGLPRMYLHAGIVVAALASVKLGQLSFPWTLAAAGGVIAAIGAFVFRRFLHRYEEIQ